MLGIDIVHIPEFTTQLANGGDTFLKRAFHKGELADRRPEHLAGLWAAKEAVAKAVGLQPGQWLDIHIVYEPSGRPTAKVADQVLEVSIAHHGEYAIAVAQGVQA